MHFQQFYLGCLAHASYLIADGGEAVVVDPQRDVDQYIEAADKLGVAIRYVIETHLHADFVSGHRELAARSGAEIVFGARANAAFPHRAVHDGDDLRIGNIELRAIETPGHTPESISWLLSANGEPSRLLTGDTLFIGDVGRPDLAGSRGFTSEEMASMLYDSLHEKILTLPDDVEVWPAHGAGSSCGRNISNELTSTIGAQRRMNWALQPMTREEFIEKLTSGLAAPPRYFPRDAEMNRIGPSSLNDEGPPLLTPETIPPDAVILDVRDPGIFCARHIAGAINIALDGSFAPWCGALLSYDAPIVIAADNVSAAFQAFVRLARVGIENVAGYITASDDFPIVSIPQLTIERVRSEAPAVLDVRRRTEYAEGHIPGAQNIPLDELPERLAEVDRENPLAVICAGGYRSSIASSLLARNGFTNVINVEGGTEEWERQTANR
ncbi:MAG: hydroxyacylglutathione hydrolase [Thermoanaerobaculia bacterium]|jgi:glyoxylase-like metal-dependent hydrolase (beta-lactamase superfamily II)/rhodanese-related sulfurtransferase|nr:hydroxyacylglutathione hydrolase [Thermoanaerobaculia bacterium]